MRSPKRALSAVPKIGPVVIAGSALSLADVVRVARGREPVVLGDAAAAAVEASAATLERLAAEGHRIYGLNTGFGALETVGIAAEHNLELQRALLRSHAAGVGDPMRDDEVRAMMLGRVNVLSRGMSGVRLSTVRALIDLLNGGVVPIVPQAGSVGASDLAPLAHMALVMIGEGRARFCAEELPARAALKKAGLSPATLAGRDAFALINGLDQTLAVGALALADAARLVRLEEAAAALTIRAAGAPADFLDDRLAQAKGHAGQRESARHMRELAGVESRGPLLRTPLSMRYAPHVSGACRSALAFCEDVVAAELNAAVDNPLILSGGSLTSNSGTTSGQEMAQAFDLLASSVASLAVASERRTSLLLDPRTNGGLPAFLRGDAPMSSGLMIAQYTAASLVAELRMRSAPASLQSISTCGNTEDQVSMSAIAARHAAWVVRTVETVVAIELLAGCRAADLRGAPLPSRLAALHQAVRDAVPGDDADQRIVGDDIRAIEERIRSDEIAA